MIDVTFAICPTTKLNMIPTSSRVLTSNLEADKRINVKYSDAVVVSNERYSAEILRNEKFKKYFIDSCDTEIVLVSCVCFTEYSIKVLLDAGKKVVFGGSSTKITTSIKYLRKLLKERNVKNLDNLIIVKGFVNKTTDLYEIIKNWKDCELSFDNSHTIYECEDDYLIKYKNLLKDRKLVYVLDHVCSWGKCKYCDWSLIPKFDYYKDIYSVSENIKLMLKKFDYNRVFLADTYYKFTDDNIKILKEMKKENIKVNIFAGIKYLKNRQYIEYINRYVDKINIGVECTLDFSLKYIRKGYNWNDILTACNNMINYMNNNVKIIIHIISDLPVPDKKSIYLKYARFSYLRKKFIKNNFNIEYKIFPLFIHQDSKMIDNKFLKITDKATSGSKYICDDNLKIYYNSLNMSRYDSNGKLLPSDHDLLNIDSIFNEFTTISK